MEFKLNTKEYLTLRAILKAIALMTKSSASTLQDICKNGNVNEDTFNSICKKVFDDHSPLDKFMGTKGFTPEISSGECMRYLKKTRGGLHVTITAADGVCLPETMEEPVTSSLVDSENGIIVETEHTNLNEFFNRTSFFL